MFPSRWQQSPVENQDGPADLVFLRSPISAQFFILLLNLFSPALTMCFHACFFLNQESLKDQQVCREIRFVHCIPLHQKHEILSLVCVLYIHKKSGVTDHERQGVICEVCTLLNLLHVMICVVCVHTHLTYGSGDATVFSTISRSSRLVFFAFFVHLLSRLKNRGYWTTIQIFQPEVPNHVILNAQIKMWKRMVDQETLWGLHSYVHYICGEC